jgi:hypothetical protein
MIGMATKLGAMNPLREKLLGSPQPLLVALRNLIHANSKLANFGALGRAIDDVASARLPPGGAFASTVTNPCVGLRMLIFSVSGDDGTPGNPSLRPVLPRSHSTRAPAGNPVERLHTAWPSAATALGRLGFVREHGA